MRSFTFFQFVKYNFGFNTVSFMKKWIHTQKSMIRMRMRINFLNNCLRLNLVPAHLNRFARYDKQLQHVKSILKFNGILNVFIKHMLRNEIKDAYRHIHSLQMLSFKLVRCISRTLPIATLNAFFGGQNSSLHHYFASKREGIQKKLCRLRTKHMHNKIKEIRPVQYVYNTSWCRIDTSVTHAACSSDMDSRNSSVISSVQPSTSSSYNIILDPNNFNYPTSSALHIKEKWFINLSSTQFPPTIQGILQLGENFCLPSLNKGKILTEFVKNVEHNINKLPRDTRSIVRNRSFPIIRKIAAHSFDTTTYDVDLIRAMNELKTFTRNNPDVIFTRADKGNVTVALDKTTYLNKMSALLNDKDTYMIVKKDPIRKIINGLHDLLARWKKRSYISDTMYRRLNCTDGVLPRAYGLPKIHKRDCPLRIIVSTKDSPLHIFAGFLHNLIYNSIPKAKSYIANSFQLVDKLKDTYIDDKHVLISLDVVSLFTNIPVDLALESISNRWNDIGASCDIPRDEFMIAIRFVLNSTFFTFNGICYQQTFGTPMGSPLSPIVADITLQDLECRVLETLPFSFPFYFRYVDDIALAAPISALKIILDSFNSVHPRIQFTLEEGVDNRLNFLDVSMFIRDKHIEFDWYHKSTFCGRYLNFESQHPLCHKKGTIIGLIDRAVRLSHPRFHQKNLTMVVSMLLDNGYPLDLIFQMLHTRLKKLFTLNPNSINIKNDETSKQPSFFNIPYISGFSERFSRVVRGLNVSMSYTGMNKLRSVVKVHKDTLPNASRKNVVYQISCMDCNASYVGQTGRLLSTRVKEHRAHINRNSAQPSVITDHRLLGHDFDWENVRVLDEEPILGKRLLSEMLFIKRQINGLNSQNDTECLQHAYAAITDILPGI